MYLRKLTIENLKRIGHLELDFNNPDGSPRMWTVIIGENGTAKTSILQAIAMTAAGPLRVNDLAGRLAPHLLSLKGRGKSMEVQAEYSFTGLGLRPEFHPMAGALRESDRLVSTVSLDPRLTTLMGSSGYRGDKRRSMTQAGVSLSSFTPLDRARSENTPHWFVAGYGVARDLPEVGYMPDLPRASVDRLRSLFDRRSMLVSTSFVDILISHSSQGRYFTKALRDIFVGTGVLPEDVVGLNIRGQRGARDAHGLALRNSYMQLMGASQVRVPLSAVAHGMQSTVAWISDFVGHILLEAEENVSAEEMYGVVLIDEIDAYLHPEWQVRLIGSLRAVFPHMQFVATTHNPVMLSAFKPEEIVRLKVDPRDGYVKRFAPDARTGRLEPVDSPGDVAAQPDPRTLTGSEILEDYFDMSAGPLNQQGAQRREFNTLKGVPWRTPTQERRLAELAAVLGEELAQPAEEESEDQAHDEEAP